MSQRRLSGVGVTPHAGVGTAVWYAPNPSLDEPSPPESVDVDSEIERFEQARAEANAEIDAERERTAERVGESEASVFDAHVQFLEDPQITAGVEARIDDGLPAEHAVARTFEEFIDRFEGLDGRMAERADDLRDVRDRLLRILTGCDRVDLSKLPPDSLVLAERLTPSDTAQLAPERIAGFATVTGGRTSHAAIFARSLGLPAVVGVGDALREIEAGTEVVVDGTDGTLVVDPDESTRESAQRVTEPDVEVRNERVTTAEGTPIPVAANVGRTADLGFAAERGADGVGLFRTEFLFVDRESPPDADEQTEAYRQALETFPDDRVVVRTLDVGGDKPVEYLDLPAEENPFLGLRGVRRSLGPDAPLFERQVRALLRAAAETAGHLSVMLPLVSTVEEVIEARGVVESIAAELDGVDGESALPEFGVMIETPAAALLAPDLVEHVDFFSVGTNDLSQYVMAAARGNDRVADLVDPRQPAVLRAIHSTIEATEGTDVWVGICGEMAGDPDLTQLLVGLGFDELSVNPVMVPQVKQAVSDVRDGAARDLAERARDASTSDEVARLIDEHGS